VQVSQLALGADVGVPILSRPKQGFDSLGSASKFNRLGLVKGVYSSAFFNFSSSHLTDKHHRILPM
jgi:hypothetical protein